MRGVLLVVLWGLTGCVRGAAVPAPEKPHFTGRTFPLLSSPALRLSVPGRLGERPIAVLLDVARPLSLVATSCFGANPPRPEGKVRAPEPSGMREWAVVPLPGLQVGDVPLPGFSAGLTGEKFCAVTLGADVLAPYALTVDALRREVSFAPSRSREAYAAELTALQGDPAWEGHLLELSREPIGDWPLLAARVAQGEARLTGPLVLSTRDPFSRLALGAVEAQGLRPLETAAGLPPRALLVDSVEVAVGLGVRPLVVETGEWASASSLGRLGPDVWGHFLATVDVQGGVLLLRRPRVLASGSRQLCAQTGHPGFDEAFCYALHTRRDPDGVLALSVAAYRDLPEGGRLHLEPLGEDGAPLQTGCRVGITFAQTSRGATTQHRLPWSSLAQSMPECHAELASGHGYALALFEEGSLPECALTCAFVYETRTRRTLCECPPTPLGEGVSAAVRRPKPSRLPPPEERRLEPEDPK
ncbi:hypothetical protein [Stigmatella aurantiaca]|uniref:Conserved uncharacterized protein n=1 Tax=Stigmatella aurantiaca (strain DW4/3-1) TaxID=378806 RepID=E3FDK1_STIAD|nr:hypothetical protein [Stigmatella aurantiaca]ADO70080.1 conserved uncharacterized protein [Stigmatella aurantiaca DW4/3-1]